MPLVSPRRPRRRRRAALAATLLVLVGTTAPSAGAAPGAGPTPAGTAPEVGALLPVTPILSIRRLPGWITTTAADARLAAGLPAILARLGPALKTSCLVVSRGNQVIFAENPTEELVPASNIKLLTATAVLEKLGAGARISTSVTASVRPVGRTLHGNLYLVGGGDPLLRTPAYVTAHYLPQPLSTSFPALAARVRAAGITRITGRVLGDEALFDTQRAVPTWKPEYTEDGDVGPLSALEVDDGFRQTPPLIAAAQPAAMAAGLFTGLLRADGVKVSGNAGAGVAPPTAVAVTSIASPPLGQVVGTVLRVSDDTGAELLTKLLGQRFGGAGSTTAGAAVIRAQLKADGLPVSQLRALDGSGLDRGNRASCELLDEDLRHVGTTGPLFAGLPVAGRTGTLTKRMVGTPAAGRVHAKTGTLDEVSALSGFVLPATSGAPAASWDAPIAFSFITDNAASPALGVAVGDAIAVHLAEGVKVPPLTAASPLPARRSQ